MNHIVITGFMGAGKTTVGRLVAARLGREFIDLDAEIERREGLSVTALFRECGEAGFRDAEHAALALLAGAEPAVIATGGGAVLREDNQRLLREIGTVVYLAVTPEEAMGRLGGAGDRPLLAGGGLAAARSILDARLSLYAATADRVVDTVGLTADEVADAVVAAVAGPVAAQAERVTVGAGPGQYEVLIGSGLLGDLSSYVTAATGARAVAVVSDDSVWRLAGDLVKAALESGGIAASEHVVPDGEPSKSWAQAGVLLERFAASGLDRSSAVVALGGGVVGDLAGFCASVYMRGIPVVHVPTTLLAQVDSSIGGKTAVDLVAGKNLAGSFWPPALVVADIDLLNTLPDAEWINGLVEAAKAAVLEGGEALGRFEARLGDLSDRDARAVLGLVSDAVAFKAGVVSADLREADLRECLNFGHTLGHALELLGGYGSLPHGLAVAEGMRFACALGERLGVTEAGVAGRVSALLDAIGAGARAWHAATPDVRASFTPEALLGAMRSDKKSRGGVVRFVLLERPGAWRALPVDDTVLLDELERWRVAGEEP
ncbi:MAG: 3-dehydroquinate synthase [Coriobacteriia bacterium]|nr:3-dehydroquinate synthase [Coriobacteriia bacterium]